LESIIVKEELNPPKMAIFESSFPRNPSKRLLLEPYNFKGPLNIKSL